MTKLSAHEIEQALKVLPGWSVHDDKLHKEVDFNSFSDLVAFLVKVAFVAEAADHHPDMHVSCRRLSFVLWTHAAGGVTEKDLSLAKQIEAALNH